MSNGKAEFYESKQVVVSVSSDGKQWRDIAGFGKTMITQSEPCTRAQAQKIMKSIFESSCLSQRRNKSDRKRNRAQRWK